LFYYKISQLLQAIIKISYHIKLKNDKINDKIKSVVGGKLYV